MNKERIEKIARLIFPDKIGRPCISFKKQRDEVVAILEKELSTLLTEEQAIAFHHWMDKNDTEENACEFFHYTDNDMLQTFLK